MKPTWTGVKEDLSLSKLAVVGLVIVVPTVVMYLWHWLWL